LADSQRLQGKLADAERSVRTAILDAIHERDIPMQAVCTDALAEVLLAGGDFRGAEQILQEAIALESSLAKPDLKTSARRARLLATARQKDGRPAEAIAALEKIVPLLEQIYGAEHLETANVLSEIGSLQRSVGQHAEAQQNLRRALRIHESSGQSDSREATRDLAHLAASLEETGDLDGAAAQYERALKMKERQVGVNIEEVAEMQLKVAQLYVHWKRFGPARELLTHAIGRLENKKGPRLPVALEEMAKLEEASGRTAEAARLRERAILVAAGIAT
jgi:serine/threonine-protein kinase